jgi:hypothetical protein
MNSTHELETGRDIRERNKKHKPLVGDDRYETGGTLGRRNFAPYSIIFFLFFEPGGRPRRLRT